MCDVSGFDRPTPIHIEMAFWSQKHQLWVLEGQNWEYDIVDTALLEGLLIFKSFDALGEPYFIVLAQDLDVLV